MKQWLHPMIKLIKNSEWLFNWMLSHLTPVADLVARIWVALHFYHSALTKFDSWRSTLFLFQHEYQVPLLPSVWAAYIGAYIELIFPVLLMIGLLGRLPAFVLFCFNLVALYAYPFLWTEAGASGFSDHVAWGMVLALLMCYGMGRLSLDGLIHWTRLRLSKTRP